MSAFMGFVSEEGKLTLDSPAAFKAFYKRFAGYEVEVEIRKKRTKRSDAQNRAFHACITPWAAEEGHNIEDLKQDILREVFGELETVNAITGEVKKVLAEPHTSKLDTVKFSVLMERTVELAAGCGVILLLPDEYLAERKKKAKAA